MVNSTKRDIPELHFIRANQSLQQTMLNDNKKNLQFNTIEYHDVHHYVMIYIHNNCTNCCGIGHFYAEDKQYAPSA